MKFGFLAIFASLLFFSGCGGENENDCNYEVSYALDKGEYDTVINTLKTQDKQCGFSEDEKNLNIAAAYIGKAGLTIVDIVNNMLESDDNGGDGFASFVETMSNDNSAENLKYFNQAKTFYDKIPGNCSDVNSSSDNLFKDSCFYSGLMQISQSANSMSLILGGSDEVAKWQSDDPLALADDRNGNGKADSLDATTRAIDYSLDGNLSTTTPQVTTGVDGNKTFDGNLTYELIKINVGTPLTNSYYKLISNDTPRSPIITDGSCDIHFVSCSGENNTTCFPCPVINSDGTAMNTNDQLVDIINSGLDNILQIANIGSGESDVSKSSDDYKKELTNGEDRNVTLEDISRYLNED